MPSKTTLLDVTLVKIYAANDHSEIDRNLRPSKYYVGTHTGCEFLFGGFTEGIRLPRVVTEDWC
ncbi:MAG: hypothetical protein KDA66_07840, partial [Planctomycetaceae bacterium]|nr:hypothetical protein [Planctomycetaceae bacterium]